VSSQALRTLSESKWNAPQLLPFAEDLKKKASQASDLEKKLCKHFQQIEIRGKRDRKVPILLEPDMLASMELLVKTAGTAMCLMRICSCLGDHKLSVPSEDQMLFVRLLKAVGQNRQKQYPLLNCGNTLPLCPRSSI
jgi:hypothetical protein